MKHIRIGSIANGIDGSDIYYLMTLEETDFVADHVFGAADLVQQELEALHYRESDGPGHCFCTSFLVVETYEGSGNFIGIAHIRWDV